MPNPRKVRSSDETAAYVKRQLMSAVMRDVPCAQTTMHLAGRGDGVRPMCEAWAPMYEAGEGATA